MVSPGPFWHHRTLAALTDFYYCQRAQIILEDPSDAERKCLTTRWHVRSRTVLGGDVVSAAMPRAMAQCGTRRRHVLRPPLTKYMARNWRCALPSGCP